MPLIFTPTPAVIAMLDDFSLIVKSGICTKMDLFDNFAREGHFPAYFGKNWDALLDCLCDFSWIVNPESRIVITHNDLPFADQEDLLCVYLEILETAINTGKSEHRLSELVVVFPSDFESQVTGVLEELRRSS